MRVLTPEGPESRDVTDPEEATNLGTYWNDVRYYLNTGDDERLRRHQGETYGGQPAVVDTEAIDEMAYQDDLDFDDIYE
jgi:hypothetical protein